MASAYLTLILCLLTLPAYGAEEQFSCWVDHEAEAPTIRCSDQSYWSYADVNHLEQPGEFQDVYCTQAFRDYKTQETKMQLKRRLMEEDLMSLALGKKARCFVNAQHHEADAEKEVAKAIELLGVGRLRNPMPPYCELADRPYRAPPEKQNPTVIHPKDLPADKKQELKKKENERLGIKKSTSVDSPRTVSEAIAKATKPVKPDPKLQLELCLALDTSGSMTDDVEFVRDKFKDLEQTWKTQYPGGAKITVIEFGQDGMVKAELRTPFIQKGTPELTRYLSTYKSVGSIEPKFDAISKCASSMTAPQSSERGKIQREVIVLSDEPGDTFPGSPSPETAAAAVKAKSAKLTLIDPDEILGMKSQLEPPVDLSVKRSPLGADMSWDYRALSSDRKLLIETVEVNVWGKSADNFLILKQERSDGKWIKSKIINSESKGKLRSLGFSSDSREALIIQPDDTYYDYRTQTRIVIPTWLKTYNTVNGDLTEIKDLFGKKPLDAIYTADGNQILISMADGAVVTADRQKDNSWKTSVHAEFQQDYKLIKRLDLSPNQKTLVVQGCMGERCVPTMTFWNRQSDGTWKLDLKLVSQFGNQPQVIFTKDSKKVITQQFNDEKVPVVVVEKSGNGSWIKRKEFNELSWVRPVALNEKKNILLGTAPDGHLYLAKLKSDGNSEKKIIYYKNGAGVEKAEFSVDGKWIYATLTDGTLLTFDVNSLLK